MGKTITTELEEYQNDLLEAKKQGYSEGTARGMSVIMQIALDIVENNSQKVEIDDTANEDVVKFIHRLQTALGQDLTAVTSTTEEKADVEA